MTYVLVTLSMLLIAIIVFTCICLHLSTKLHEANVRIELLEIKANYCEQSEKTLQESVDIQTKCIRSLNDIVKKSVKNKEPIEHNTEALFAGWDVEDPELWEQPRQIDTFRMQKLISALHCKNITPIYPWSQAELYQILGPYGIREERMNEKIFS